MKAKASGELYISAVGGGKIPVTPRIGVAMRRQRIILRMMLMMRIKFCLGFCLMIALSS